MLSVIRKGSFGSRWNGDIQSRSRNEIKKKETVL